MLKRLLIGLILGFIVGALVAAALVAGFHMTTFPVFVAYICAAVTGVVVGLVAGKPIWAKGGQIEAGLKAFFGALLGAGGMFAIRQWLKMDVDLSMIQQGMSGPIGDLPAAALPLIAAVLGGFYELDNTGDDGDAAKSGAKTAEKTGKRVSTTGNVRVGAAADDDDEEAGASAKKMKR
jgi:hypothetical protein